MDAGKLADLRRRVADEPHDARGRLVRELLAHVEAGHEQERRQDRARLWDVCAREHLDGDELLDGLAAFDRGETIGFEEGGEYPCRACDGTGARPSSVRVEDCPRCWGRGKVDFRIVVPG